MRSNVVYDTEDGGLMLGSCSSGNHDNVVENNIFVNGRRFQLGAVGACQDAFRHNIVYTSTPGPFFFDLPGSALLDSNYNVFFGGSTHEAEFSAWRGLGYDSASVFGDPVFRNVALHDHWLQPESPALAPPVSFQQIDTSNVGPPSALCFEDFDCLQSGRGNRCIQRECYTR